MNYFDVLFGMKLEAKKHPAVIKKRTGNPIELTDGADAPMVKCVTAITGSQDLHGYDKPWVGGSGKNKLDLVSITPSKHEQGITFTVNSDGTILANGTATGQCQIVFNIAQSVAQTFANLLFTRGSNVPAGLTYAFELDSSPYTQYLMSNGTISSSIASVSTSVNFIIRMQSGTVLSNVLFEPMLRASGTTADFTPYSNICPITAYTEGEIEVSDGDGNTTTHTTTYPSAIYRGSEDVVNGTVGANGDGEEWIVADLGDLTWYDSTDASGQYFYATITGIKRSASGESLPFAICENYAPTKSNSVSDGQFAISSNLDRIFVRDTRYSTTSDFTTAVTGVKLAYELATPTTSSVTPTNLPIKSLSGYNHIESSTGELEIEYIAENYQDFVDVIENTFGNGTRKGGMKAIGVFRLLDPEREPEPKKEDEPEKEPEKEAKK